ncbi:hypothetical protein IJ541_05080 [bacterium]|nr:hypothetical protein [bacterium]
MFLHKPLCPRYKDSTVKIFGWYVCRSCLLLYSGFILTLLLIIPKIKTIQFDKYFALWICGCILTLFMSYPPLYSKFRRITKDFVRFYDGIFLASVFVVCFKSNIYAGILSIFAFILLRNLYNKKRTGDRICKGCENLNQETTCVGYQKQKEALLKIEEEYSNIRMRQTFKERNNYD